MEKKIGEEFEIDGQWYKCVEGKGCNGCCFDIGEKGCLQDKYSCSAYARSDRKPAQYIKISTKLNKYFARIKIIAPNGLRITRSISMSNTIETAIQQQTFNAFDKVREMYPTINIENLKKTHNGDVGAAQSTMGRIYNGLIDIEVIPLDAIINGDEDLDKEDTLFVLKAVSGA